MEDQNENRFRIQQVIIFSILMGGILISVIGLYATAKPFIEDLGKLNLYLILALIVISTTYVWAVISGIPPKPPRKEGIPNDKDLPKNPLQTPKPGDPISAPTAGIKSGIPPSPRKTNG